MAVEKLTEQGVRKIAWAWARMPVLKAIAKRWEKETPLKGIRIAACLHCTAKTANLVRTLKIGGAQVALCASNPLSTQDDVVAALNNEYGIDTHATRGDDNETYYGHIRTVLDTKPNITVDDGADLVNTVHSERQELIGDIIGGCEETTTGVIRLRAMAKNNYLKYPVVAVNDALTKHLFDNRFGTGQSTMDGILRATNCLIGGSNFVVVGFGWCGRGIASRARGLGARVIVVEVDPVKALEAVMDGYNVLSMSEAAPKADFIVTATGNINVVDKGHLELLKDGAIICNAGHFNVEINIEALEEMSITKSLARDNVEDFLLANGKHIYLIAEGRLVNLAAGEGHPMEVMDMSFANQALSVEWLAKGGERLENKVYRVPDHIDRAIAALKLEAMGISTEKLTEEQEEYLNSWEIGT